MASVAVASFNVENLFTRPKAFNTGDWAAGEPILAAYREIGSPSGAVIHVLVNQFKSQSGGGGEKRRRQATEVRRIVDGLVAQGAHVVVRGDLNEGPPAEHRPADNLAALVEPNGPRVSCYDLAGFDVGDRPGTFDACGIRDRLDYILLSRGLRPALPLDWWFRRGLWGTRRTRPARWETYPEMTSSVHQASDHAAVVRLDL